MSLMDLGDIDGRVKAWGRIVAPKGSYVDQDGVCRDRFSRPLIIVDGELVPMQRASGFCDLIEDKSTLQSWRLERIFKGIMVDKNLGNDAVVNIASGKLNAKFGRGAAVVNELAKLGGAEEASQRGTIVHKALEEFILDGCQDIRKHTPLLEPLEVQLVENGAMALEALGLEVIATEVFVANEAFGVAGTADLVVRFKPGMAPDGVPETLKDGTAFVADWKTYKQHSYNRMKTAVQMAMYAGGAPVDLDTGEIVEWDEPVHQMVGMVIHIHPDGQKTQAHFLNLAEGRIAAKICRQVREARRGPARFDMGTVDLG